MKKFEEKLFDVNIQMFAEDEDKDLKNLINEVSEENDNQEKEEENKEQTNEEKTTDENVKEEDVNEEDKDEQNENDQDDDKEKQNEDEQNEDDQEDDQEDEEDDDDKEKNKGVKGLRKAHKEEKKKAKALEEEKKKLQEESNKIKEKLLKAIKLGIKGETEEEILENLEEHEVKEEANKSGLTEDQIKKEKELKEQMEKLSSEKKELVFNRRAYNLQVKKNLSEKQMMDFIKTATRIGLDLTTNTSDFSDIYDQIMVETKSGNETEKDAKIRELENELKKYKKEKAPSKGVKGNSDDQKEEDWEKIIEKLEEKK